MTSATGGLPRLLTGRRRRHFAELMLSAVVQAALVALTALLMPVLLNSTDPQHRLLALSSLAAGALVLGAMRAWERVSAEKLGQDYVQQIRTGLVASSLVARGPSVGITVARTTNDLNSVRNWIALGVTPLVVGVPVIGGTVVALALLDPRLAIAALVPLIVLAGALVDLARPSFARSRELRRHRGRLAAHVSDTVHAAPSIRSGGGLRRELRHVDRRGQRVADAAVARARVAGLIRGSAVAAAGLAMVLVAAVGSWGRLDGATIATALTLVGLLVGPVSDLGRVVEYRQSYRAARRIIGPALAASGAARETSAQREVRRSPTRDRSPNSTGPASLQVTGLVVDGTPIPDLAAQPGDRVVLHSADQDRVQAVVHALSALSDHSVSGRVVLAGQSLLALSGEQRRRLVGHAGRDLPLERGTVGRAVRYRRPRSAQPIEPVLAAVGLAERVAQLPDGERTTLRRGGEPLSMPERAQVRLARALYGDPPLLVLDHLEAQLGSTHLDRLRACVATSRGVVLVASSDPTAIVGDHRVWDLDVG